MRLSSARTPETVRQPSGTKYEYPGIPTTCDGAEAVVHVETQIAQAAGAYPITSSTTMGGGFNAAVAGDNFPVFVDQDGGIEAEGINAFGDRPHLCPVMVPRVTRVRDEVGNRNELQLPLGESCSAPDRSNLPFTILGSIRLGSD